MNVLILGGNRFVGKKLAEELLDFHTVTIVNRSGTGPAGCNIVKHDRNLKLPFIDTFDVVIDFCLFKQSQVIPLLLSLKREQKYVFISSAAVYKDNNCLFYNESMPIGGLSAFGQYGVDKSECERLLEKSSLKYIIFRPPYIIGEGDTARPRLSYYYNQLKAGLPVKVSGDGNKILSFLWADDMVSMLSDLVNGWNGFSGIQFRDAYNVVSEDFYTSKSLVNELAEQMGVTASFTENCEDAPFPNEHLLLSGVKLGKQFSNIKKKLTEFRDGKNTQS